jgi:hypothetical protein
MIDLTNLANDLIVILFVVLIAGITYAAATAKGKQNAPAAWIVDEIRQAVHDAAEFTTPSLLNLMDPILASIQTKAERYGFKFDSRAVLDQIEIELRKIEQETDPELAKG